MGIQQRFLDRMNNVKNSGELVDASQDVLRFNDYAARLDQLRAFISVIEDHKIRDAGMSMLSDIAEQITLYTENLIVQRELVHKLLQEANDMRKLLLHSRSSTPNKGLASLVFKLVGRHKQAVKEMSILEKITDNEQRARQTERKILHLRTQLEHTYMVRCELLQQSLMHNGVSISGAYLPKIEDQMQILDKLAEYNTTLDVGSLKGLFMLKSTDVPSIGYKPAKNKLDTVQIASSQSGIKKTTPKVRRSVQKAPATSEPSTATILNKAV